MGQKYLILRKGRRIGAERSYLLTFRASFFQGLAVSRGLYSAKAASNASRASSIVP